MTHQQAACAAGVGGQGLVTLGNMRLTSSPSAPALGLKAHIPALSNRLRDMRLTSLSPAKGK